MTIKLPPKGIPKGQPKSCLICNYEFLPGDMYTEHLISKHPVAFFTNWFYETVNRKKIDKIFSKLLIYEEYVNKKGEKMLTCDECNQETEPKNECICHVRFDGNDYR